MLKITLPVSAPKTFRIIAHRGASGYAPENTMAAFRLAQDMGVEDIEFDVQFSKDRKLMICHDPTLDRYGHPGMKVSGLTCEELKALDMGSWFGEQKFTGERMITLEELFGAFGETFTYHLEIKLPAVGLGQAILDCITAHKIESNMYVTSFDFESLVEFSGLNHQIPLGWLVREQAFTAENVTRAAAGGFTQFCPLAQETTRKNVQAAHETIKEIRAHNIKTKELMIQAVESGCDGMTINWPDWLTHKETP